MTDKETILQALDKISYGLYVVTSCAEGKANGLIANTVVQVALEPPRVSVCLNKNTLTHTLIQKSGVFGVSVLNQDAPMDVIRRFGFQSGRDRDKLDGFSCCSSGVLGCVLLTEYAVCAFEAKVFSQMDVGTHTVFAGDVVNAVSGGSGIPLTYTYYRENKKGKSSANAPTYRPPSAAPAAEVSSDTGRYVCSVCGYVYDQALGDPEHGVLPGTPFEKIPDSWRCPICGVGKDKFDREK